MFPPEIFSEIFSFLRSDACVLLTCSRTHPIFAQLIEPSLYAHVVVHNRDGFFENGRHLKLQPYQLSTLLSDTPRVINYLRSLCVELSDQIYKDHDQLMKGMTTILPRLKLERIRLTFYHHNICAEWESFPTAFRTAFVACISTSYMKEICLDVSRIPLSSFADCAGLKRLTLCQDAVPPPLSGSLDFPQLEALELCDWEMDGSSGPFFSWMLTHAAALRSLTLRTPLKSVLRISLPPLLTICSASLVNLNIYYTRPVPLMFDPEPIEVKLPSLPNLERLRLCTYTSSFKCPQNSDNNLIRYALFTIAKILQDLSSLKHLTLIICLEFTGKDITQVDWSPLSNFLSDRRSSFQHTDLHVRVYAVKAGGEVPSDQVISMLSRCENLTSLVESGHVSIKKEKFVDVHLKWFFGVYY